MRQLAKKVSLSQRVTLFFLFLIIFENLGQPSYYKTSGADKFLARHNCGNSEWDSRGDSSLHQQGENNAHGHRPQKTAQLFDDTARRVSAFDKKSS